MPESRSFMETYPEQHDVATVGRFSYGKPTIYAWTDDARLTIGSFCSIADGVKILLSAEHPWECVTTYPLHSLFEEARRNPTRSVKGDIAIGNDVWIGHGAIILSGITIGHGAVIGAGSVVAKDVPPYAIVGGNPARILRYRFEPDVIEAMLRIQWWDWPLEKIERECAAMRSVDVRSFVRKHDPQQLRAKENVQAHGVLRSLVFRFLKSRETSKTA